MKYLVIVAFIAIIGSLGAALLYMMRGGTADEAEGGAADDKGGGDHQDEGDYYGHGEAEERPGSDEDQQGVGEGDDGAFVEPKMSQSFQQAFDFSFLIIGGYFVANLHQC